MKKYILIITLFLLWGCKKENPIEPQPIISFIPVSNPASSILPSDVLKVGELKVDKNGSNVDRVKINLVGVNPALLERVFVSTNTNLKIADVDFSKVKSVDVSNVLYENLSDTIPLLSGGNTFYFYIKIKDKVSRDENGKAVAFTILSLTNLKNSKNISVSNSIVVNIGNINVPLYATINAVNSYVGDSKEKVDLFLLGKSVAKAFVLDVVEAGVVKVEISGRLTDGSLPISDYWINGEDSEDLGVAASTFQSKVAKTKIPSATFFINLKKGVHVLNFKTTALFEKVAMNTKVGLKITLSDEKVLQTQNILQSPMKKIWRIRLW